MTSTITVGNIAGYVNSYSSVKLVGLCRQNEESDIIVDKDFGYGTGTKYVIYSDYDGTCTKEGKNETASPINKTENDVTAASPYATINPKQLIDSKKFLTGDGVSSTARTNIASDTVKYKNVDEEKAKFQNGGDYYGKLSDFNTETGAGIADNFPVLVVNDTNSRKITDMINSYIHLLTNENSFDYADYVSGKYKVDISQYKYENNAFVESEIQTLKRETSRFKMTETGYDNANNQFTLIDVQYLAPNDISKIAYHLYVPVMVEKMLKFKFSAAALSGTDYKLSSYENKDGKPVMENYGTPVTARITYSYQRTAQEWADAINNGENVLKNYDKSVTLTSGNQERFFPNGTKFTLVDRNNYGKPYYYNLPENNGSTYSATLNFSEFNDESSTAFTPSVSLFDLLEKSADITITIDNDGNLVETENANDATVKINGKYYRRKTDEDTTVPFYKVTVTAKEGATDANEIVNTDEQYYLSIYTPYTSDSTAEMINITLSGAYQLTDTYKIGTPTKMSSQQQVQMIWGNLYEQVFSFKTTNSSQEMGEENNSISMEMSTTISLASSASDAKTYLSNDSISLFHGFVIDANKKDDKGNSKGIKGLPGVNVSSFKIAEVDKNPTVNSNSSVITIYSGDDSIKNELKSNGSVTIACKATLQYELFGIVEQFPEKADTEDYGTTYEAYSNIAYADYNVESSSMSANKSDENNNSYYRAKADIALTTLSYNVPSTTADEQTNLGVNGREKSEIITADGYYNVSELSSKSQAEKVKFTLELYKKNSDGNYEKVNIGDYLKNISAKNVTGVMSADNSEVTFTEDKDTFKGDTEDTYTISTSYEVKTGKEFEENSYFYANYKVVLTGELLDKDDKPIENSSANDHIIYTNAKIFTEFIQ